MRGGARAGAGAPMGGQRRCLGGRTWGATGRGGVVAAGLLVLACFACFAAPCLAGVSEISYAALQKRHMDRGKPLVAIVYDPTEEVNATTAGTMFQVAQHYDELDEVGGARGGGKVDFVAVNYSKEDANAAVRKAKIDLPKLFVSTKSGTEHVTADVTSEGLSSLISHKLAAEEGGDLFVFKFRTEDEMYDLIDFSLFGKPVFAKFYEAWCPHSTELKPIFSKAAALHSSRAFFVEVECSVSPYNKGYCAKNGVREYPTLMFFTGEDKVVFREPRSLSNLESFLGVQLEKLEAQHGASKGAGRGAPPPGGHQGLEAPVHGDVMPEGGIELQAKVQALRELESL